MLCNMKKKSDRFKQLRIHWEHAIVAFGDSAADLLLALNSAHNFFLKVYHSHEWSKLYVTELIKNILN